MSGAVHRVRLVPVAAAGRRHADRTAGHRPGQLRVRRAASARRYRLLRCPPRPPRGGGRGVKLEEIRPGVFSATLTAHELSVVMAGARMSLSLMDTDPDGTTEQARSSLEAVLASFDAALARTRA